MASFLSVFVPEIPDPFYSTVPEVRSSVTTFAGPFQNEGVDLSEDGPYEDAQIAALISQASRLIDGFIKGSLMLHVVQEDHVGSGSNLMQLRQRPLWRGIRTTLTAPATAGDTSMMVQERVGMLAGQYVLFPNRPDYPVARPQLDSNFPVGPGIDGSYVPVLARALGPGIVPLASPLTKSHLAGEIVAVNGVDTIAILLPYTLQPIPIDVITQRFNQGQLLIWTPLEIQLFGTTSVFPRNIPLRVQYTAGFETDRFPPVLKQACLDTMIYMMTGYRFEGVKRVRSAERALEFGEQMPVLPAGIRAMLSRYVQTTGFV